MSANLKFVTSTHQYWINWIQHISFIMDVRQTSSLFFSHFLPMILFSLSGFSYLTFKRHVIMFSKFRASVRTWQSVSRWTHVNYHQLLSSPGKEMLLRNLTVGRGKNTTRGHFWRCVESKPDNSFSLSLRLGMSAINIWRICSTFPRPAYFNEQSLAWVWEK